MRLNTQRAKEIMNLHGITPDSPAYKTGMTAKSIDWILRNGFVSNDALERIASAFDVMPSEIFKTDYASSEENEIEFLKDDDRATVTFSQGRFISKIKRLAEEYPDDVKIIADNLSESGNTYCLCASLPVSWIVRPGKPKELSEAQIEAAKATLQRWRDNEQSGTK